MSNHPEMPDDQFDDAAHLNLAALVAIMSASSALAQYEIRHFDEPIALQLSTDQVALLSMNTDANLQDAFGADAMRDLIGGWRLADITNRSADDLEALAGAAPAGAFASPVFLDARGGTLVMTPDVLVQFHPHVNRADAEAIAAAVGTITDVDWAGLPGAYRIQSSAPNGFDVLAQANALAQRPETIFAQPDMLFTGQGSNDFFPTDPLFVNQWGLHNEGQNFNTPCFFQGALPGFDIDAPQAWGTTTGADEVIIVVIDTGTQLDHPDLLIDPALGADFTDESGGGAPVNDCDNHGTPVAGTAGALLNDYGVVGAAPTARVASARTFIANPQCDGSWMSFASWTVETLDWAHDTLGARVTNNSNGYGFTSAAIEAKYLQTRDEGMIHFASAGNTGTESISYPARLPMVNAISNVTPFGELNDGSSFGQGIDFAGPGTLVASTDRTGIQGYVGGDFVCVYGTSFASPHAAGVAALVLSLDPSLTGHQAQQLMRESATDLGPDGYDIEYGWGMFNAAAALKRAQTCPVILPQLYPESLNAWTSTTASQFKTYDNFLVNADMTVREVAWQGWYRDFVNGGDPDPITTAFRIEVYDNVGGVPGSLLFMQDIPIEDVESSVVDTINLGGDPTDIVDFSCQLPVPHTLAPGTYWLSIESVQPEVSPLWAWARGVGLDDQCLQSGVARAGDRTFTLCTADCPADLNGDGELTILDFIVFQTLWQAQEPAADCDGNGAYNVLDFVCFQLRFDAGCN